MASSSVSQESLDMEDFENQAKRNRIRTHRGRGMIHRSAEREGSDQCERDTREQNGDHEKENNCTGLSLVQTEHDSPTRGAASRIKDKRSRPNHLHKGKLPKDKRKLREKRRSTGVVHLPSTESTGDSLDEDDDTDTKALSETKKNTTLNETSSVDGTRHNDNYKHSHHHTSHTHSSFTTRRNKSPSDLEADLEDNQDYDSTVSRSETNLTLIGQSESCDIPVSQSVVNSNTSGGLKFTSRYSESRTASTVAPSTNLTDSDSKTSSSATTAEILSRYRDKDTESPKKEIDGPRPFSTYSQLRENRGDSPYGSYLSRLRERDATSPVHQRINYNITPRPFLNKNAELATVEKLLDKEKEENKKLKEVITDKDRRIAELEKEVKLLNRELDELDDENIKLQEQNSALIKAMSSLSTAV